MSLAPGQRLGPYEVQAAIGAGGMGEVYRARDTRLGRDIALKVLPDLFAADPDRIARFEREAHLLASLNHPQIAAIYGFEVAAEPAVAGKPALRALVLELVDGPTLADRLTVGPLPLDEALRIAGHIADALEAAHALGIIHRDLKPANIKVRADGTVKVLDFGLAKMLERDAAPASMTLSPTLSVHGTSAGLILGTAAYMSPEQARGLPVDRSTDVWSFGCVLFEMIAGRRVFDIGGTVSDAVAAILRSEPDWPALPASTPPPVRRLLRRCLAKDLRNRLHDIADARLELADALSGSEAAAPQLTSGARGSHRWLTIAALAAAGVAILAAGALTLRTPPADTRVFRSSISIPATLTGTPASRMAISPDGTRLVFGAPDATGRVLLWVRPLDGLAAQPLTGTEGASAPFFSPDGRFVAFVASNKLKKIDLSGGPAMTLADTNFAVRGSWNKNDLILFSPSGSSPIASVKASGGAVPTTVTTLDSAAGETRHSYPFFLPDGRHFLFLASKSNEPVGVYIGSLDSPDRKRLLDGASNVQYASGHLLFLRGPTLMAQKFDPNTLAVTGDVMLVAEQVSTMVGSRTGAFSVSENGVLAYQMQAAAQSNLVWFDRSGRQIARLGETADFGEVSLSPDGARAAVSALEPGASGRDIWVFDVARGLRTRFTFDPEEETTPIWSPDGLRLVFSKARNGRLELFEKASSGAGSEKELLSDPVSKYGLSWSPDGRHLLYAIGVSAQSSRLAVLNMVGDPKPTQLLKSSFDETPAVFSPDGRWIAYSSNESGRYEVYVTGFTERSGKWQVSVAGGDRPRWRRDGRELFYLSGNKLMSAAVTIDDRGFAIGAANPLFDVRPSDRTGVFGVRMMHVYDVTADGQRFIVNTASDQTSVTPVTLVVNWPAALSRR
jgi:Tol biopolymer transport system component